MQRREPYRAVFRHAGVPMIGLVALISVTALPVRAQFCADDCDGSRSVTVDEVVAAARIGLGAMDVSECPNADANHDGTVGVDELVLGVDNLLKGCGLPPAEAAPAAALAAARLAEHIHALSRAVAVAFDGADRTEICVYGGILQNTCEDSGTGFIHVDVDARSCRVESLEGDVTYDGPVALTGQGNCSGIAIPFDLRFAFDWTGVTQRDDGTPHSQLHWQGSALLESFTLGSAPCSVKGATAVLDGRIDLDTLDGATIVIEPKDLHLVVEFRDLLPDFACEPQSVVATLDGAVRIEDTFGSSTQVAKLDLASFKSSLSRVTRALEIEGQVEGDCFGGVAHLATIEPLDAPLGTGCFDAGLLQVGLPAGTAALRFGPGGTLDVDADGNGTFDDSYASCGERPVGRCATH